MTDLAEQRNVSRVATPSGLLFALVFTLVLIEFFSFVATKAGLLLFNETPWYTTERYVGLNWRTDDQPWGAWHAPNATDRHVTECFDVTYQSNNVGARDTRDYSEFESPESIVLLGDSFAEGYGVNIEDSFAKRVERQSGRPVLNFGTAGYVGPVQQVMIYEDLASLFPHSEVIYLFLPENDFVDNAPDQMPAFGNRYRPYYKFAGGSYAVVYPENAVQGAPYPGSAGDTRLANMIESVVAGYTYTFNTLKTLKYVVQGSGDDTSRGYFTDDAERVDAALFFVNRLLSAATKKKITLIVAPGMADMQGIAAGRTYTDKAWYTGLKQVAANHGARFVDLAVHTPQADFEKFYLACDYHWTAAGEAFAAERYFASP